MPKVQPLTWHGARSQLKELIEAYLRDEESQGLQRGRTVAIIKSTNVKECINWSVDENLDVYLGAAGVLVSLVVTIVTLFVGHSVEKNAPSQAETIGSVVLQTILLANLWILYRLSHSELQESHRLKRREASNFLRRLELEEIESSTVVGESSNYPREPPVVPGTSLTGMYPVLRRKHSAAKHGSWSRVPVPLLVSGDVIALQVGDVIPADCKPVESNTTDSQFKAGEKVTSTLLKEVDLFSIGNLPHGRTTLEKDSEKLLNLCHNMTVFVVVQPPIVTLLSHQVGQERQPRVMRQLRVIRAATAIIGIFCCIGSLIVLISRSLLQRQEGLYVVPFLASMISFPLIGPTWLLLVESMGTARILSFFHCTIRCPDTTSSFSEISLFVSYVGSTMLSRLALGSLDSLIKDIGVFFQMKKHGTEVFERPKLVPIPPASLQLLAKLGVTTALTVIDDDLLCESGAVPQQLLIPSGKGLKLLDICPSYEDMDQEHSNSSHFEASSLSGVNDSDSDSDGLEEPHQSNQIGRDFPMRPQKRWGNTLYRKRVASPESSDDKLVQFEDPLWWQHLPSLKSIGLACLLVDSETQVPREQGNHNPAPRKQHDAPSPVFNHEWKGALVQFICREKQSEEMFALARCIGFSGDLRDGKSTGDTSSFVEVHRFHIVSCDRALERLQIDTHERDSEQSRWWGLLRPDSTSVVLKDTRSGSFQLLTVGDPRVVIPMCNEAWQGENSTILPLSSHDRAMILAKTNSWQLGDLSVKAFSYTPIPYSFETDSAQEKTSSYLLENDNRNNMSSYNAREKQSKEWQLLQNQVFLGVLGSCTVPRQNSQGLLKTLQQAGVRFVFMSPRNMRLTKEIAAQMGIDIAWNAAISLRPLGDGEEDQHRMISNYADWDINAKLPHGIESVKRHLRDVDNVPLLVSLFTDVTKPSTRQMIDTFQEYGDTVLVVGLSHLTWNTDIFATADLAIGVDTSFDAGGERDGIKWPCNSVLPSEIEFVSAISGHGCAFRLSGVDQLSSIPSILAQGRISLDAVTAAALFLFVGIISLVFFLFFSTCAVTTVLPIPDTISTFLALQFVISALGLSIATTKAEKSYIMHRVPPKNLLNSTFGKREGETLLTVSFLKALPIALLPHLVYPIVLGELILHYENGYVLETCGSNIKNWLFLMRCQGVLEYNGLAKQNAVTITFGLFLLCLTVSSSAFVHRTNSIRMEPPWQRNKAWLVTALTIFCFSILAVVRKVGLSMFSLLPWYAEILIVLFPPLCLWWAEILKYKEKAVLDRAEKLRRLQFETRLGMWSPK